MNKREILPKIVYLEWIGYETNIHYYADTLPMSQ